MMSKPPKPPLDSSSRWMAAIKVIRRAHAPGAAVDHGVDELVGRAVEGFFEAHGVFEVVALESSGADAGLLDGFLAGLGYVDGHDQPPLLTVHGLAVLLSDVQGDLPERVELDGFSVLPGRMPSERTAAPCLPASCMPEGDWAAATAMGKWGWV